MSYAITPASAGQATDTGLKYAVDKAKEQNSEWLSYHKTRDAWQAIIGAAIAAYGLIQQHEMIKRQIQVMERAQTVAEEYLALAQHTHWSIAVPTYERQRDLFDTSLACFQQVQCSYLIESQRLKEYTPEYDVQMGRAIGVVQQQFDRAQLQRSRAIGPYASGRCCDDSTRFAIARSVAIASAVNHGYRFEEARKRALDAWYWDRQTQGGNFLTNWRGQVISGLNGGAQVAIQSLNAVGGAVGRVQEGAAGVAQAYGNMAQFWGGVAQLGIAMGGFATGYGGYGAGRAGSMGGTPLGGAPLQSGSPYGSASLIGSNSGGGYYSMGYGSGAGEYGSSDYYTGSTGTGGLY
jgi:hypothetical protein